jgi:hypothetical protein
VPQPSTVPIDMYETEIMLEKIEEEGKYGDND